MSYRLWIDDDAGKPGIEAWRNPPPGEDDWKIAHSSEEAMEIVLNYGIPTFIDFDHDLGLDRFGRIDTSRLFLDWLWQSYPRAIEQIVGYNIHSANPDGAKGIRAFMESWARSLHL